MKRERGYIAMLSVEKRFRKRGIASKLVEIAIEVMTANGSDEVSQAGCFIRILFFSKHVVF